MAEFLDAIETIKAGEADIRRLFGREGVSVRSKRKNPKYEGQLIEAASLISRVMKGNLPVHYLQEAMTTSDFPLLFGDVLDRQILASYNDWPQTYRNYVHISEVPDFRLVSRFTIGGGDAYLSEITKEMAEYPAAALEEGRYQYKVKKYGRRIPFSFEARVNDDLDFLRRLPEILGRAARRTEERFAASLFVGSTGPDSTLYSVGNANIVTSNPVLSAAALQTALTVLSAKTDEAGEPIVIDMVELVIPPALLIPAQNILNASEIRITNTGPGGSAGQEIITNNWMKNMVRISVNPYIPLIATSNDNTSWFLFANPSNGRPALEMGFLRGHSTPEMFMKSPNSMRVGGGEADPMDGDYDNDGIEYKLRHILGGTQIDPKSTVASNGSGS